MTEKRLIVVSDDEPAGRVLLALPVLDADMPHPGWMRFTLESGPGPDWEQPTVCWYRVPDEARSVELQDHLTDADVLARIGRQP